MGKKRKKKNHKNMARKNPAVSQKKEILQERPELVVVPVKKKTEVFKEKIKRFSTKPKKTVKESPKKKIGRIAGCSVAGILAVGYLGGMLYLKDKYLVNTTINGVDVSCNTVEEAEEKMAKTVEQYLLTLEERDGDQEVINAEQIGYHYVSGGELENFKKEQKMAFWPVSVFKGNNYTFQTSTVFDAKKLQSAVKSLKCFSKKVEVAPTDAYMDFNGTVYEIVKETQGKKVKKKKLMKVLKAAISEGEEKVSLEENGCYAKPKITEKNKNLNQTVENVNQMVKTNIVYWFGDKQETLNGKIVRRWISMDEKGNPFLDEEKVAMYVSHLADRYDTYGKPRKLITHDGSQVTVEGGKYGWLIDQEAETAALIEMIKNGGSANARVPVYAQTAVSHENSDLGQTYAEVDLTNQHVWLYQDGKEVVSTDMVSGTYNISSRRTPGGTYTIYYKKSPAVLTSNTPGDSYASPVTYWMPFNGGIGFHDASWRGSFGGSIYQYSGSHGCINLPTWAAKEIYGYVYKGMPVICYYR